MLQCVALLQCVAVRCVPPPGFGSFTLRILVERCGAMWCSVVQCGAV